MSSGILKITPNIPSRIGKEPKRESEGMQTGSFLGYAMESPPVLLTGFSGQPLRNPKEFERTST